MQIEKDIAKLADVLGHSSINTIRIYIIGNSSKVVLSATAFTYNGKTQKPSLTVTDAKGNKLADGSNYEVTYEGNPINVGRYKVVVTFKGNYTGSKILYYNINAENVTGTAQATLTATSLNYNGKVQRPGVIVKDRSGKVLRLNADYVVQYFGNGKNVGTYNVKVTFKGNYTGTKTLTYTINPMNTKLKSVKKGSRRFTAKWSKQTKEVTGYQIRYSLKKNMTGAKTVNIKKNKTTSYTAKKLKGNKKYYVQIRTYKKVGGKTYYSSWSGSKTVKTKK